MIAVYYCLFKVGRRFLSVNNRGFLISFIIYLISIMNYACTAENLSLDKEMLHQCMSFAQQYQPGGYHIKADVVESRLDRQASKKILEELAKFEKELDARIARGDYPGNWRIEPSLDESQKAERIAIGRQSALKDKLEILQGIYKPRESAYTIDFISDSRERQKATLEYQYKITDGIKKESSLVEMRVFNPDFSAIYNPIAMTGKINLGSREDRGLTFQVGSQPLLKAGTPVISPWASEQITSITKIKTDNGPALRISCVAGDTMKTTPMVAEVLPEKGCRLSRAYFFLMGRLSMVYQFGQYKKLSDGQWYPYYQEYIHFLYGVDSELVRKILKEMDWDAVDQLDVRRLMEREPCRRVVRNIQKVEVVNTIADNTFDLVFPAGTRVIDARYEHDIRMILGRDMLASEIAYGSEPGIKLEGVERYESIGLPFKSERVESVVDDQINRLAEMEGACKRPQPAPSIRKEHQEHNDKDYENPLLTFHDVDNKSTKSFLWLLCPALISIVAALAVVAYRIKKR